MSRFKVKGINDEQDACMCCGKTGLKRVVWIEDTETSEVWHFGTSCAENPTKAFGVKSEIRKAVREFDKVQARAKQEARDAALVAACREAWETFTGEKRLGKFGLVAVDSDAFQKHKQAAIAKVKKSFT